MAPVLSGVWWGPEAGVVGSGEAASASASPWWWWPGSEQLVLVVALSVFTLLLLMSVLLLLCASCQGQKKTVNGHSAGDQDNLVNGVSERETASQSADSPVTDVAVSSSHNGPLTSGTILTDTQDTSPHPSEEMLSSQSELRSSKCPQDRELPSIPPNNGLMGPPASGDSTYEVVKEMAVASRDVSVEDSLYETVKELKAPPTQLGLANGTAAPASDKPAHHLLNGHLSPGTAERVPLCAGAEYASIDLKKKSRHSVDMEARRRSENAAMMTSRPEPEEDTPPPVPEKVLDENDNQPVVVMMMNGLHNGELLSPPSPPPGFDSHALSDSEESAVYSTVNQSKGGAAAAAAVHDDDKEHDYSSIAELKGLVPASSSSDLYASVRDIYAQPGDDPTLDGTDPGYETIRIPKTSGSEDERGGGACGAGAEGAEPAKTEPDYESVGELGLGREASRL